MSDQEMDRLDLWFEKLMKKRWFVILERFLLTSRMGPGCRARDIKEYEQDS